MHKISLARLKVICTLQSLKVLLKIFQDKYFKEVLEIYQGDPNYLFPLLYSVLDYLCFKTVHKH